MTAPNGRIGAGTEQEACASWWRSPSETVTAWVVGPSHQGTFASAQVGDLTPVYVGAQAVLSGADPYSTVAARTDLWLHLLFYPLPAVLIVLPLVWFPMKVAATYSRPWEQRVSTYTSTRDGWWRLWMLASAGFWQSIISVQWTPCCWAQPSLARRQGSRSPQSRRWRFRCSPCRPAAGQSSAHLVSVGDRRSVPRYRPAMADRILPDGARVADPQRVRVAGLHRCSAFRYGSRYCGGVIGALDCCSEWRLRH